ncbi:MAG TPA: hypothetical protein VHB97_05730 [Polyangia bacterium]|jgi:hypothetical protein|nr:hypothetical protein [Polyangia bacterium]
MAAPLLEVNEPTVRITVRSHGSTGVHAEFTGVLGQRDPGKLLTHFFDELHKLMVAQHRSTVSVDFRGLRFMNSSCFKYFAKWIKMNNGYPQPHEIHFVLNREFHWQEVSIHALRCFSQKEITIEKVAGQGA